MKNNYHFTMVAIDKIMDREKYGIFKYIQIKGNNVYKEM